MRTLIATVIFAGCVLVAGCDDPNIPRSGNTKGSVDRITIDGHRYVRWVYDSRAGIAHDPDCPKCRGDVRP